MRLQRFVEFATGYQEPKCFALSGFVSSIAVSLRIARQVFRIAFKPSQKQAGWSVIPVYPIQR